MDNEKRIPFDFATGPYVGESIMHNDILHICTRREVQEYNSICYLIPYTGNDCCDICGEPFYVCTCNELAE